jgi:hypothetical protein
MECDLSKTGELGLFCCFGSIAGSKNRLIVALPVILPLIFCGKGWPGDREWIQKPLFSVYHIRVI